MLVVFKKCFILNEIVVNFSAKLILFGPVHENNAKYLATLLFRIIPE